MCYEPAITDLAAFKLDGLDTDETVHPAVLDLVRHLAVIAADTDWKVFRATGLIPYTDPTRKESG
jgi:hypothetical protein